MKKLKFIALLFLFNYQTSCTSAPNLKNSKDSNMQELKYKIKSIQDESQMPGLQIVVTEGEKVIFEYTNGIRAFGLHEVITPEDQWHIGSCTKPMTAFLVGRLIDQKIINWKTTLEQIPLKNIDLDPTVKTVTIEQLLSHSSGLAEVIEPENGQLWPTLYNNQQSPQIIRDKLVRAILKMPVHFQPGTKFEYSNSGYVVLGWILEQLKSSSWEKIITEEMFQKLGMKSCGFGPAGITNTHSPVQPWSHQLENNQIQSIAPGLNADNPLALGPAGTVHCNAKDWRKFLSLFTNNEGVRSGYLTLETYNKLLSNANKETPHTYSSIGRMDRSWAKGPAFAMSGSNTMNYAIVAIAPNLNRIFTVNTNAGHSKAEESATKILKLLTEINLN